jgi:hypothetical protein
MDSLPEFGACEEEMLGNVGPPRLEEPPSIGWLHKRDE